MNNIEELKRLAEAATPGPWLAEASWQSTFLEGKHDGKWAIRKSNTSFGFAPLAYVKGDKRITGGDGSLNAQFIAAANPAAVLELIAEVERVTKQRYELESALERLVELANNDGLWCNYDEVIHAEAVLEQIYKSWQEAEG